MLWIWTKIIFANYAMLGAYLKNAIFLHVEMRSNDILELGTGISELVDHGIFDAVQLEICNYKHTPFESLCTKHLQIHTHTPASLHLK